MYLALRLMVEIQTLNVLPSFAFAHYPDIGKNGAPQGDVSLGDPDDFVDEGDRWVSFQSRFLYNAILLYIWTHV
jgi:hypothetical protein